MSRADQLQQIITLWNRKWSIDESNTSWPRPCLGKNKPSTLTGGKFKIFDVAYLIVLYENNVILLSIRSTHTNDQPV